MFFALLGALMPPLSVGEHVVIRNGQHKSKKAQVVEIQRAEVYRVRFSDGSSSFFSRGGLERAEAEAGQNRLKALPSLNAGSAPPGRN